MGNVLFSRSSTPQYIPITDGQIIFDTSGNGKMYVDVGSSRMTMGGAVGEWLDTAYASNGLSTNVLNVSSIPTDSANRPLMVARGVTANLPNDCSYGVRNVKVYNNNSYGMPTIFVEVLGFTTNNETGGDLRRWVNTQVNGGSWSGWQKMSGDFGELEQKVNSMPKFSLNGTTLTITT